MKSSLPKKEIVLLGVGHTNAHVVRMWKMSPLRDARLTCVSNFPVATYSGMLPGYLAKQYTDEQMEIDLVRLCAAVGARLVVDEVIGIDREEQCLLFRDRPPLHYDVLSIGVGSVPIHLDAADPELVLAIKPMQTFRDRLSDRLERIKSERTKGNPIRVAIVGAGLGGVEVTFCLPARLKELLGETPFQLSLVSRGDAVPNGALPATQSRVRQLMRERGYQVITGDSVVAAREGKLLFETRAPLDVDLVIWAPSAAPPPILKRLEGLPRDPSGFLATNDKLQLTNGDPIFAVGDTGSIQGHDYPKAGVYAVRQGMVLWPNIKKMLANKPLKRFVPQQGFLKLINTGDGKAILEYRGRTFYNRAAWWLKDQIDTKFMAKYQDYRPMEMAMEPPKPDEVMRCAGCGGKVAGSVLSRVLRRLDVPPSEDVLLGLDQPDDAAILRPTGIHPLTVTVDFFSAPLEDAYLVGRIAALNSASDLFAMGVEPSAALAMSTIPIGRPRQQEKLLEELLAGSLHELRKMNATLVGGHTTEGPQIMIGFTMLATHGASESEPSTDVDDSSDNGFKPKSGLQQGDYLVLTKPLGTGALLAGHMRAECRADWMTSLLDSMLNSNQIAARIAIQKRVHAITDVTGFGLAGHLLEMLNASQLSCELTLSDLPLLPGAAEMTQAGIESTLAPHNRDVENQISVPESLRNEPAYQLIFDPQTSGGLLLSARESEVDSLLTALRSVAPHSTTIGRIVEADGQPQLRVLP